MHSDRGKSNFCHTSAESGADAAAIVGTGLRPARFLFFFGDAFVTVPYWAVKAAYLAIASSGGTNNDGLSKSSSESGSVSLVAQRRKGGGAVSPDDNCLDSPRVKGLGCIESLDEGSVSKGRTGLPLENPLDSRLASVWLCAEPGSVRGPGNSSRPHSSTNNDPAELARMSEMR